MILNLFRRKNDNDAIVTRQYDAITQAARRPVFYSDMNVPDTVLGRYDMMSIHIMLYLRKTKDRGEAVEGLAQEVVDAFFQDIDHSIRELGIGDAGVPKRMKKLANMFYGRFESYGNAIDKNDYDELEQALKRNIHPAPPKSQEPHIAPDMADLAAYLIQADQSLSDISRQALEQGQLDFPEVNNVQNRDNDG